MSINPTVSTHVTLDLLAWHESGSLELSPKFQRRPVWKAAAKSYFIDTLLRGYPVPPIHVRLGIGKSGMAHREIIDGQQRLRAVFDYVNGRYRLSRSLNGEWAGKGFNDLSPEQRDQLMMYKFHGFQYENLDDARVLEIFARINTYSVALSRQELRNGKYFGVFKTTAFDVARERLEAWRVLRIFTETGIARMQEVELTSELLILLMDGPQDKKASIDDFYKNLDEAWGNEPISWTAKSQSRPANYLSSKETVDRFNRTMEQLIIGVGDLIPESEFTRVPLFYSLFSAIAHRSFGLPGVDLETKRQGLDETAIANLRETVTTLSELLSDKPSPDDLTGWQREFVIASSRQTDNVGPRQQRLSTIWNLSDLSH